MNHRDHVNLIKKGVEGRGGIWADLGSGTGAFTLALAELLGTRGEIHSVDKNGRSLEQQQQALSHRYPNSIVHYHTADFRESLPFLPPLDGLLMANSLHFVRDKEPVLANLKGYLARKGRFVIVEYDTDRGNQWVPYPLSFTTWQALASRIGFVSTALLHTHPSRFLGRFYAALSH